MPAEPTLDPAALIAETGADLTAKLVEVAQQAVRDALDAGRPTTVADVLTVLEGLTESLPAVLAAEIDSTLTGIAETAVERAEVSIADARAESGRPFPTVVATPAGDYSGWATTTAAALVAAARKTVETAQTADEAVRAASEAAADAAGQFGGMAETAAARTINESRVATFKANSDIVKKLEVVTVHDAKRSEVCAHMDGAKFDPSRPVPTPPYHNGCRSYLKPITGIKRKAGATDAEINRQNWAIFRRLEREAKAASAEGRGDERLELRFAPDLDTTAGTFSGYATVWDVTDNHKTAFAPGSLRLPDAGLPVLWAHDPARPVGTILEARDDGRGMFVRGKLSLGTRDGTEAHVLLRDRAITGLSIGFKRLRDEPMAGGRRITAADLKEVSLVTLPSNESARVTEVRALPAVSDAAFQEKEANVALENQTAPADTGETEHRADTGAETRAALDALTRRLDKVEARAGRAGLAGGEQRGDGELERRAFERYLRGGRESMGTDETRALRLSDDEAAGYLAPPEFVAEIDRDLAQFSPIRGIATVRGTSRSEVNTLRRTSPATATWTGEDDDREETDVRYGQQSFPVRELATFVDISLSLLEDAAVDVAAELSAEFAEAFGLAEGQAFVSGNGVLRPLGFMSDTSLSFTNSGHASQITADGLIDLFHAQKPAYRQNGTWLMNSQTLAACRKLKDNQNRYLVDIGGMAGAPSTTLMGRPVLEDPNMPDIGAGAFPVAFGDFRIGFRIYDRIALSVVRDDFTQRTKGRVRFHGRRRVAAGVRRAEAIRKLRISAS